MVDVVDDNGASPNLERNVGYVTSVVGENEGKLTNYFLANPRRGIART